MNFIFRFLKKRHPFEYSQIIDQLYVAAWPTGEDYDALKDLGVRLVINMDWVPADKKLSQPPLRLLIDRNRHPFHAYVNGKYVERCRRIPVGIY